MGYESYLLKRQIFVTLVSSLSRLFVQGDLRGIMSPTELKMQPTIHCNKKPDIEAVNVRVFLLMNCELHFLFRRAHYSS
jgi:hypothetical protein